MGRLVAIDPGTRLCGYAMFDDGVFQCAGIVRWDHGDLAQRARHMGWHILTITGPADRLVIERMKAYREHKAEGVDPQDLIDLSYASGVITGCVALPTAAILRPLAPEWKGGVPKGIHNKRVRERCPKAIEFIKEVTPSLRHNAWDAVGLGLWGLIQL